MGKFLPILPKFSHDFPSPYPGDHKKRDLFQRKNIILNISNIERTVLPDIFELWYFEVKNVSPFCVIRNLVFWKVRLLTTWTLKYIEKFVPGQS